VLAADLNGDQHKDIAGGSSVPGTVAIWYGNGRGGWSSPFFLALKGDVRSITSADFDTDGRPDLALSIQGNNPGIQIWLNRGQRGWEKGLSPADSEKFNGVRAGDVNADGNPDLAAAAVVGTDGQGGIRVWLGDGEGGWITDVGPIARDEYIDVELADFNEDGHPDICGSSIRPNGALRVWLGDGEGGWSILPPLELGNFYALTAEDLNRDGHLDLFSGTYQNGISLYLGDGRGGFLRLKPPVDEGNFWKVLSGDVDGDGEQELVASSLDAKGIWAWKWKDGKLSPLSDFHGASGTYHDMALVDLDSDGPQDLIAASNGQGVTIWASQTQTRALAAVTFKAAGVPLPEKGEDAFPIDPVENEVFIIIDGRPQYKIGPEDILEISLWKGIEEKKYLVEVRPDGKISFAFLEGIEVSDLTVPQVDDILTKKLGYFVKRPRVDVRVSKYESKFVSLLGAISTTAGVIVGPDTPRGARSGPGNYALTGRTTVLQALSRAGGPTDDANLRQIKIRRKTGQAVTVNLNKTITQGDLRQNVVLDHGDTVMVPPLAEDPRNRVFVFGEVKNPGVFPTRGDISVMEAVALAGGFDQRAVLGSAKVLRGDMTKPEVIACDLNKLLREGDMSQNIALHNGDLLFVPKNTIGRISDFLKEIQPTLEFIIWPARVWRAYTD
jgi:protein involved in polysaccharide export with SLBB domain